MDIDGRNVAEVKQQQMCKTQTHVSNCIFGKLFCQDQNDPSMYAYILKVEEFISRTKIMEKGMLFIAKAPKLGLLNGIYSIPK